MAIRELNTTTKIETCPAPVKPGHRLYRAPRSSAYSGLALRVTKHKDGKVSRMLQVIALGPDRKARRVFLSDWPNVENTPLSDLLQRAAVIRNRIKAGAVDPYPPDPNAPEPTEPTIDEIWTRFEKKVVPKYRAGVQINVKSVYRLHIKPPLGKKRPSELTFDALHDWYEKIAKDTPTTANRAFSLLRNMFNRAKRSWKEPWALNNPCDVFDKSDKAREEARDIRLSPEKVRDLLKAIDEHPQPRPKTKNLPPMGRPPGPAILSEKQTAACIKLIALTGCRKSEALTARWSEFNLESGVWTKPSAHTKNKKPHTIPLMPIALEHVKALHKARVSDEWLFPQSEDATKPQGVLKRSWRTIIKRAGLNEVVDLNTGKTGELRIHDLRHVFASIAISSGVSLAATGRLLGHTTARTTERYAHLLDHELHAAVAKIDEAFNPVEPKPAEAAE